MKHRKPAGRLVLPAALFALLAIAACPGGCWGPQGHELITAHAIQLLPVQIKPFYEANSRYLAALSMLPDDWRVTYRETGPDHYCDLDMLDEPPFRNVRGSREQAEERFGKEEVLKMGVLPWVIEDRFKKLVDAFRSNDSVEITVQSALLAHYVGDAHVPFHATKHWDGCKPEHKGVHFRWETALLALHLKPESVKPSGPAAVTDILDSAFDWLTESHSFVERICAAEDRARETDPTYAYHYYRVLSEHTLDIAVTRLTRSAEALAGVWIAAWEQAGRPELTDRPATLFWGK